jgi:hypothetical protein
MKKSDRTQVGLIGAVYKARFSAAASRNAVVAE